MIQLHHLPLYKIASFETWLREYLTHAQHVREAHNCDDDDGELFAGTLLREIDQTLGKLVEQKAIAPEDPMVKAAATGRLQEAIEESQRRANALGAVARLARSRFGPEMKVPPLPKKRAKRSKK
jgi:hypothetical protein